MRPLIRPWVERTFRGPEPKLFLELGAHKGEDTAWLSRVPGVLVHAFEPDPRNHPPPRRNVVPHREAIAAHDGRCPFILSEQHSLGRLKTASSSIRRPKTHLMKWPDVTFGETIEVECTTLDTFVREAGIDAVDFIWADVQGAERDMVAGGRETLAMTRYLFTEYCPDGEEWYEGQATCSELLSMLPGWTVLERWPHDMLLCNEAGPKPTTGGSRGDATLLHPEPLEFLRPEINSAGEDG